MATEKATENVSMEENAEARGIPYHMERGVPVHDACGLPLSQHDDCAGCDDIAETVLTDGKAYCRQCADDLIKDGKLSEVQ